MLTPRTEVLAENLQALYADRSDLLFHGWHHVYFVACKAVEFAAEFPHVDQEQAEAAGLTHDLNFLIEVNTTPDVGRELREQQLTIAGFDTTEIAQIEKVVIEKRTVTRHADISDAAKVLSDADTLFKALPITPILFASRYIRENQIDLSTLARKVVSEQQPLMEQGIYFYTEAAKKKYLGWATVNLALWRNVVAALNDPDVKDLLDIARGLGVL